MTAADDRLMTLTGLLRRARAVPVIRVADGGRALAVLAQVAGAGLPAAELTTTTPGWADALTEARTRWPALVTGVGTVVTAADARQAVRLGAGFLVSPYPAAPVREVTESTGVPFIEGGFTPAEIAAAASHGIAKLFPAHAGGPSYLRSLLSVLPGAAIIPTGGIEPGQAGEWLAAGALAVGLGRALLTGDVSATLAALTGISQ